jgi:lipid II:glycine glycyltransferase (peptidoglycan interpeptide bridge formation enzyme)
MQWHIIEQGHEAGWRRLDFGGAEPDSLDPKMQGIYQFKAKWGGELVASDRLRLYGTATQRLKNLFPKRLHHGVRRG